MLKENESQSTDCSCTCHLILGWVLIDRSILSSSLSTELAVERFGNLDVWFYYFSYSVNMVRLISVAEVSIR